MMAPGHGWTTALLWSAGAAALASLWRIHVDPLAFVVSLPVAAGAGLGPDIDCPRRVEHGKVKYGSVAAETHGAASRWAARAAAKVTGGHRHATHWAATGIALGWAVAQAADRWPAPTVAVALGVCGAWFAFMAAPHASRHEAVAAMIALAVASMLLPIPAGWVGPAVAFGFVAHDLEDWVCRTRGGGVPIFGPVTRRRFELGLFHIDGPVEHTITAVARLATVPTVLYVLAAAFH